ncbi:hypothetical protein GJ744_000939 [Endocarpon pusillum]|uniref:Apple domain-containing protein n=1 Tax=Endocarpon pusillum TaxID=364733 RepID=A0A8H7E277_9EURO|nr:hypothetical protein GJ744_000939 [Endocarpon pusillum]
MGPRDNTDLQPPFSPAGLEVTIPSGPEAQKPSDSHNYNRLAPSSTFNPDKQKDFKANNDIVQDHNGRSRPPYGLSFIAFTCVVMLVTAIVVGAAVGGGLGSSLAHERNENEALRQSIIASAPSCSTSPPLSPSGTVSSATATSTTGLVDYVVAAPDTIDTVELECPGLDGTSYLTVRGQTFDLHCGDEMHGDDVGALMAYRLPDCIEACSYMNRVWANATFCNAVLFVADVQRTYPLQRTNCFLKNATTISATNREHVLRAQLNTG